MASSLRLNLITKSFRPILVSATSRFLSIAGRHQSCSTMPIHDDLISDQSSLIGIMCPKMSSLTMEMSMDAEDTMLILDLPGNEDLTIDLNMPGLKREEMRACTHHNLFIQGNFDGMINLPDKTGGDTKEDDMKNDGMFTTPPNKDGTILTIIANEIISSFRHIIAERSWAYYDMFYDRTILGKGLCPIIAAMSSINSFSIYKKETSNILKIQMSMPGLHKVKLTTQVLSVYLNVEGLRRNDVNIFFDYDTLFIEGKTKTEHYITGIRLPVGIHYEKSDMIEIEMEDGDVFCATIPCCVKKEDLLAIKYQFWFKLM